MAESENRRSGKLVVVAILVLVALGAGGLIWHKNRPRTRVLPFTLDTPTGRMLLVPAGRFVHGEKGEQGVAPAFYIDQTEVTNRAYAEFCKATDHPLPPGFPENRMDYPVVNVSILDATAFAKWAGKRLPDPLEWEKAARGATGYTFPWGNDPDPARANVSDNPKMDGQLLPADSMPQHPSPSRALHMAGNVAEFVRIAFPPPPEAVSRFAALMNPLPQPDEPWYTVRGGSFDQPLSEAVLWKSAPVPVRYYAPNIGFRCAKDPPR